MEVQQSVPDLTIREFGSVVKVTPQTEEGLSFVTNKMRLDGFRYGNMFITKSSNLEEILKNAIGEDLDVDYDME